MRLTLLALAALIAFLALVSPARAESTATWGGTGCTLRQVEGQAHVAEMSCENRLNAANTFVSAEVEAEGLIVTLRIVHGPGEEPDWFHIEVPPGFYAEPQQFDLEEDAGRVVLIYEWVGM